MPQKFVVSVNTFATDYAVSTFSTTHRKNIFTYLVLSSPCRGWIVWSAPGWTQRRRRWPKPRRRGGTTRVRWECRAAPGPNYTWKQHNTTSVHPFIYFKFQMSHCQKGKKSTLVTNLSLSHSSWFRTVEKREYRLQGILSLRQWASVLLTLKKNEIK